MNFINDRELARRFQKNAVPQRERLYYIIVYQVMISFLMSSWFIAHTYYGPEMLNVWDYAIDISSVILTVIGILISYQTNSRRDNKEFIERLMCLGFPVTIQTGLVSMTLIILAIIVLETMSIPYDAEHSNVYSFLVTNAYLCYYFVILNRSIKIAAGKKR